MTIERNFDVPFVAQLAFREKQIQQNYRPIISVHKWFARRPGTLFRGLLLSEFGSGPLQEIFFRSNNLRGVRVADPFMGGGTPLIEANRLGCNVVGYDINPMAYWVVQQEIDHLDLPAYREAAEQLIGRLEREIGGLYRSKCVRCGNPQAKVKYFLWVKIVSCHDCGNDIDLFPRYLLSQDRRHPKNVLVCPSCGDLNEVDDRTSPGGCASCGALLSASGPVRRSRYVCPYCRRENVYPLATNGVPRHRMFAIEYHCPQCRPHHKGRFFKKPDEDDLANYAEASSTWENFDSRFVPDDVIPHGDETDRLHKWGYTRYREMFNPRQLLALELSCRFITDGLEESIRYALATNLSDLLRYQNMLCRYDTMALKSLDIFSIHGYPVGLIQCESNFIGIAKERGGNIGSGGWTNIVAKYSKAKAYCEQPFEIRHDHGRKIQVPIAGEWIGRARSNSDFRSERQVELHCQSSSHANLAKGSLDGVFTDPPYFGNVQYAELMDFCYVWLRRLVDPEKGVFSEPSTRSQYELTGNTTLKRGLHHFMKGLSEVFQKMADALKPGAPFVFTYHHNKLDAYHPIAVAILDAGLTCSASLPCPAEMSASIHINGTGSSIVDTIFVCRSTGTVPRRWIVNTLEELASVVQDDLDQLCSAGVKTTAGDARCIIYGHLTRLAVWRLRKDWDKEATASERVSRVKKEAASFGEPRAIEASLGLDLPKTKRSPAYGLHEEAAPYGKNDEISF